MNFNKQAHDKFLIGDGITDNELADLIEFYSGLVERLEILGPAFYLATKEARSRFMTLEDFHFARTNHWHEQ